MFKFMNARRNPIYAVSRVPSDNHTIASKADGQKESIYNILHGDALNWREELGTVSVRSGLSPLEP
jgi:hypothetical protein